MALIRAGAVGAVNIKLLKTALAGAREIAATAQAADLPIVVGSMFETEIGTAASLHFAATLPGPFAWSEIGFPVRPEEDALPASPYLQDRERCTLPCLQSSGIGVPC